MQDLEKQLYDARKQNLQLRTMLVPDESPSSSRRGRHDYREVTGQPQLRAMQSLPNQRGDYQEVRRNIRLFGRGINIPAFSDKGRLNPQSLGEEVYNLPAKRVADELVSSYERSIHQICPFLDLPRLVRDFHDVIDETSTHKVPQLDLVIHFAVLAVGSLYTVDTQSSQQSRADGPNFYDRAIRQFYLHSDRSLIERTHAAFLLSVYCRERNLLRQCRNWLAIAINYAVDLGLQWDLRVPDTAEHEMRRLLWLSIYSQDRYTLMHGPRPQRSTDSDRLLALESSRPLQIAEDDCKVLVSHSLLSSSERGPFEPQATQIPSQPLVIEVIAALSKVAARVKEALRLPRIPTEYQQELESELNLLTSKFHEPFHPSSTAYLNPSLLWISTIAPNTRLLLRRQNMLPQATPLERSAALASCAAAARETVLAISRSQQPQSVSSLPWEARIRSLPHPALCTHLWRCILFLSLSLDFTAAAKCAHVNATIGDLRTVNVACARNLVFFLNKLRDRILAGAGARPQLDADDEMLAYASGDLQGDPQHAWIWEHGAGESGVAEDIMHGAEHWDSRPHANESKDFTTTQGQAFARSENDPENDLGGWARVEALLTELSALQLQQREDAARTGSMHRYIRTSPRSFSQASGSMTDTLSQQPFVPIIPESSERLRISNIIRSDEEMGN